MASLIQDGVDGFLCDTAEDFSQRIAQLLEHTDLACRLGASGKEKVLERYNWQAVAAEVIDVYRDVIASRAHT